LTSCGCDQVRVQCVGTVIGTAAVTGFCTAPCFDSRAGQQGLSLRADTGCLG
jgi:hypothetical protein